MKRTIFIGQAMPRAKRDLHDWPSLNSWLYSIGISEIEIRKHFFYTALVDYFPGSKNGSHLVPTTDEIETERVRLQDTIAHFNPELVVPIGKLSIAHCLQDFAGGLDKFIGNTYVANPYGLMETELPIVPLPHPSGASVWRHKTENKILLEKALNESPTT